MSTQQIKTHPIISLLHRFRVLATRHWINKREPVDEDGSKPSDLREHEIRVQNAKQRVDHFWTGGGNWPGP